MNFTTLFVSIMLSSSSFAWSVDVENIDWPIGKKLTYSSLKNEDFEIPGLEGFSCTVMKNSNTKKKVSTYRSLLCFSLSDPNAQFQVRTFCDESSNWRNNLITITKRGVKNKLQGYTISLNCN